ncbi:putative integron cassette domain protein [Burkholderia vietnamiensis LMG 10929]|nr:putative integron cassette domain protein [Burkholderia vietnamiensis LMG 10929]
MWQASGADVFSEGFRLLPAHIEAVDFNRTVYRLDYATGEARHS